MFIILHLASHPRAVRGIKENGLSGPSLDSRHLSLRHLPMDTGGLGGSGVSGTSPAPPRRRPGGAACQQVLKFVQSARDQIPAWRRTRRAVIQHPGLLDSSHSFPHGGALVSSEPRRWEPDPMRHDPPLTCPPPPSRYPPPSPSTSTPTPTHPPLHLRSAPHRALSPLAHF